MPSGRDQGRTIDQQGNEVASASAAEPPHKPGLIQTLGLDVRVAILTVLVDLMAFSGEVLSAGLLYPVEIGAAGGLGFITYKIQKSWYGDDRDSALIKAAIVALVTAIPVPISGFVAGPGGLLGLLHLFQRKGN